MKRIYEFFVQKGWLSKRGSWLFLVLSWFLMLIPLWLASKGLLNPLVAFLLFCCGLVIGLIDGYEGQAKRFGFLPPFTNDPLGWRKAKHSYKEEAEEAAKAVTPPDKKP